MVDTSAITPLKGLLPIPPPAPLPGEGGTATLPFASQLNVAMRHVPLRLPAPPVPLAMASTSHVLPADRKLAELEATLDPSTVRRIDNAARDFEGVFLKVLLGRMQKAFGDMGGVFGQDSGAKFYSDFAFEQLSEGMAQGKASTLGFGKAMYEVMLRDEARKLDLDTLQAMGPGSA